VRERTVLLDVIQPSGGDLQVKTTRASGGDAVLVDQFGRPEEDGASATRELPNRKPLGESSRKHKTETGTLVSVRVETKSWGIERVGQGEIPELFRSAHFPLNAGEGSVVLYPWHSSGLPLVRSFMRW
jgi:hypothetical protein